MKKTFFTVIAALILIMLMCTGFSGCGVKETFVIVSGSENKTLESILEEFGRKNGIEIEMQYKGSLDIMNMIDTDAINEYDAVWPANSMWISMGDTNHIIKNTQSIMSSPIVFGVKKSLAESLGLTGKDVYVEDILTLIREDKLSFMMTSSTQSNSGACAYIGFISALLGNPDTITLDDLENEQMKNDITDLLGGINRSSGSSGWLKELFLKGNYDAMVNYESMIIEANQELISEGKEPLYLIYLVDGLAIADSPLGLVDKGDEESAEIYAKLVEYLLSDSVQEEILNLGRRTGFGGSIENTDPDVWNTDWGIDPSRTLSGIRMPDSDVIMAALSMYQSELKKPACTVYCLDYSGSMAGDGESQLEEAMSLILNQDSATQYLLQATDDDITIVIPFDDKLMGYRRVDGNENGELTQLALDVSELRPDGGTDIYTPAIEALHYLEDIDTDEYFCAIVLLTDGESNTGSSYYDFEYAYEQLGKDIPLFSIMLGDASSDQLEPLAELTLGKVFDSHGDLISAFKKVKGYN